MIKFVIFYDEYRSGSCYYKEYNLDNNNSLQDVRKWLSSDNLVNFIDCSDNVYCCDKNEEILLFLGSVEELEILSKKHNIFQDDYNMIKVEEEQVGSYITEQTFDEVRDLFKMVIEA